MVDHVTNLRRRTCFTRSELVLDLCTRPTITLAFFFVGCVQHATYRPTLPRKKLRKTIRPTSQLTRMRNTPSARRLSLYVHRDDFALHRIYKEHVLERIPANWPEIDIEMLIPPSFQSPPF